MSLTSRLSIGVTFGLLLGLSTPFIIPTLFRSGGFAAAQAQTQSPPPQSALPQSPSFGDVPTTYWAYDYIEGLAKLKIISGFGDGTFRPNDPVTRAQFSAILRQAFITNPASAQSFADVPANYWAAQSIGAARSSGFLSGYPGNLFKPEQNIPRVQVLVSLANGLKYASNNAQKLTAYTDASEVPTYARSAIAAADEAGLVVQYPYSDQLEPNRNATRADVAAFVYQALVKQGRATAVTAPLEWRTVPVATISTAAEQMSFSKNGQQLVTLTKGGTSLQVWNTQTSALLKEITAAAGTSFREVAISEDGTKVTAISQAMSTNIVELAAWTVATGEQLWQQPLGTAQTQLLDETNQGPSPYFQAAFSPNGQQIVTQVNWDNRSQNVPLVGSQTSLHDAATGDILQSLKAPSGDSTSNSAQLIQFAFSADGKFLASANRLSSAQATVPNNVDIWQINQNNRYDYLKTISFSGDLISLTNLAFTNSGFLNVLLRESSYLTVPCDMQYLDTLNAQTGQQIKRIDLSNESCFYGSVRLTANDQHYSINSQASGLIGNLQTGKLQEFEGSNFALSSSGDHLAAANNQTVFIFAKATN